MSTGGSPDGSARHSPSRSVRPTRWAAGCLALIALVTVVLPLGIVVPLLAVAALGGCVLVDLMVARAGAHPWGTRTPVPTLALRVPVPHELAAHVAAGRPERLRQPLPAELDLHPDEESGDRLRGELVGRHRGVHELPTAVLRVTGPLGLASCDHRVISGQSVTVFPDLPKARRAAARLRGRSGNARRVRSPIGLGTEFESIRDYTPDDDIRHINWVASSRVGRPMSNQYRIDEDRDVICMVDTGRLMASPVDGLTRLDVALDAATMLAVAAEGTGDRVGAIAFDAAVTRQIAPRRRGAEGLVRALFDLEPKEIDSDYERAFVAAARHRRALLVIFTDLVDDAVSRSLFAACPMLTRHHTVLVASCRDPDLHAALSTEPANVRDVVRTALAIDLLRGQKRAESVLRSLGAAVITAAPDRLGSACVQSYLRLKYRARV